MVLVYNKSRCLVLFKNHVIALSAEQIRHIIILYCLSPLFPRLCWWLTGPLGLCSWLTRKWPTFPFQFHDFILFYIFMVDVNAFPIFMDVSQKAVILLHFLFYIFNLPSKSNQRLTGLNVVKAICNWTRDWFNQYGKYG